MKYQEGIILEATYGKNIQYKNPGYCVRLVIKMFSWGYANMYFVGDKIDKLFDDFQSRKKNPVTLEDMVHQTVFMPPSIVSEVPSGLTFRFPEFYTDFVENSNGDFDED